MAAQASSSSNNSNTSTVAQAGSVSSGQHHHAPAEPPHLSIDRVLAHTPDKVLIRASFGTTDIAQSKQQHRARIQRILDELEPKLPTRGNAANDRAT